MYNVLFLCSDSYRSFELLLDTPGSKVNRKLAFFVEANKAENKYAIKYEGWSKKVSIEGEYFLSSLSVRQLLV